MIPCAADPPRWAQATKPDAEAQWQCRTACPIRVDCLRRAAQGNAQGIWGGVLLNSEKNSRLHGHQMDNVLHALAVLTVEVA